MTHMEGQQQCLTTSRQSQHSWPTPRLAATPTQCLWARRGFLHSEKEGVDPRATEITGLSCISQGHPHIVQKPCLEH